MKIHTVPGTPALRYFGGRAERAGEGSGRFLSGGFVAS